MSAFWLGMALIFFGAPRAHATTTISSIGGASNYFLTDNKNAKVYGGNVFNLYDNNGECDKNAHPGANGTCNSCDGNTCGTGATGGKFCPCNETGIVASANLTVVLQTTIDMTGRSVWARRSDSTGTTNSLTTSNSGGTLTITGPWSAWCDTFSSTNCATDGTIGIVMGPTTTGQSDFEAAEKVNVTIYVKAVDQQLVTAPYYTDCPSGNGTAGTGFCHFKTFRGDQKIYVLETQQASDFPTAGSNSEIKYTDVVFFFNENQPTTVGSNAWQFFDVPISTASDGSLSFDPRIKGLQNDTKYCLVMGNKDSTGIISNFTDPAAADASLVCSTPTQVEGLLDDKKCFIATAAYGSSLDPHVDTLRQFRAKFLMPYSWGRKFVKFYYEHSPAWAEKIRRNDKIKSAIRIFLWPVVGFAGASLEIGFLNLAFLFFGIIGLSSALLMWRRKYAR